MREGRAYVRPHEPFSVGLSAVIVEVRDGTPFVRAEKGRALPSGPFEGKERTLEQTLRSWVRAKAGTDLGYVEQLYTFADKDRWASGENQISIGYLALIRTETQGGEAETLEALPWYELFPWEDRRDAPPEPLTSLLQSGLKAWKGEAKTRAEKEARAARIAVNFPDDPKKWNDELVLQRYELLWEADLLAESRAPRIKLPGLTMPQDHRRIVATGIARLRAKIKYKPVVFELLPDTFTLLELQTTVEALAGLRLHKQNFRRFILNEGLVEETKETIRGQAGRPAKLYAFRHEILRERAVVGTKLPRT